MAKLKTGPPAKPRSSKRSRNFWLQAHTGLTLPDGTIGVERTLGGGSNRILAGLDVELWHKTGPSGEDRRLMVRIECRSGDDGKLQTKVIDNETGTVVYNGITYRDGSNG